MDTKIYDEDTYINPNIPYVFNRPIIEYDMKEAGWSLTKEYKLLDKDTIEKFSKYKKEYRTVELGKLQRNNEDYKNQLKEAFPFVRKLFFDGNGLENTDIISIKKDAIFSLKKCKMKKIGEYIEFRPKHTYTSYVHLSKKIELYYNEKELEVKGLGEDQVNLHKDYMLNFINLFFVKMETETRENVIKFLVRFINRYKKRLLDVGYYRTFDSQSNFYLLNEDDIYDNFWEDEKDRLDISYNYHNVVLKLLEILI